MGDIFDTLVWSKMCERVRRLCFAEWVRNGRSSSCVSGHCFLITGLHLLWGDALGVFAQLAGIIYAWHDWTSIILCSSVVIWSYNANLLIIVCVPLLIVIYYHLLLVLRVWIRQKSQGKSCLVYLFMSYMRLIVAFYFYLLDSLPLVTYGQLCSDFIAYLRWNYCLLQGWLVCSIKD